MSVQDKLIMTDQWNVSKVQEKEYSVEYTYRKKVPDGIIMSDYPYLLSILWKYEIKDATGLADEKIAKQQIQLNEILINMDKVEHGLLMASVVGNARREWILYVTDPDEWLKRFHHGLKDLPDLPLAIHQYKEPEWNIWNKLINAFK